VEHFPLRQHHQIPVVLLQLQTQAACVDPDNRILPRIECRSPVEYFHSDQRLLQAVCAFFQDVFYAKEKKSAEAVRICE
jgi:hypothetical protein